MPSNKFEWTQKVIETVEILAGVGLSQEGIADYLGISTKTLQRGLKKLRKDDGSPVCAFRRGRIKAEAKVAKTAYDMAISQKHPSMTQFWLKARAGWKETEVHEHTGADGQKLTLVEVVEAVHNRAKK